MNEITVPQMTSVSQIAHSHWHLELDSMRLQAGKRCKKLHARKIGPPCTFCQAHDQNNESSSR